MAVKIPEQNAGEDVDNGGGRILTPTLGPGVITIYLTSNFSVHVHTWYYFKFSSIIIVLSDEVLENILNWKHKIRMNEWPKVFYGSLFEFQKEFQLLRNIRYTIEQKNMLCKICYVYIGCLT